VYKPILKSPRTDQSWRIQVGEPDKTMASNAAHKNGLVLLSLCRNASGMMVQPSRAATGCEVEPAMETVVSCNLAQMDTETVLKEFAMHR
jgi:hypothetical protein